MTERQARGPEQPHSEERNVSTEITPVIARIIDTQTENGKLKFDRINKASHDSRKTFYEGNTDDFETRREKWVKGLTNWVEKKTDEAQTNREERIFALHSVGIDADIPENLKTEDNTLEKQVENFRQKYLDKDESKVGRFVEDIAKDCEDEEGHVNLNLLSSRLSAIKDMLVVFGTDKHINILVEEFAVSYGNMRQKDKQATMNKVAENMTRQVAQGAHERLRAIGIDPHETKEETSDNDVEIVKENILGHEQPNEDIIDAEFWEHNPNQLALSSKPYEQRTEEDESRKEAKNPQTSEQARQSIVAGKIKKVTTNPLEKGATITDENKTQGVVTLTNRGEMTLFIDKLPMDEARKKQVRNQLRKFPQDIRVTKNPNEDTYDIEKIPAPKRR